MTRGSICTYSSLLTFDFPPFAVFLGSSSTLHLVFNLPLAKLYVNSLLSTLNARAFTNTSRYTMHSSGLKNMGGNNALNQQESGAVRSTVSAKGFNEISSNSEATAIAEKKPKTSNGMRGYFAGKVGTRSQPDANNDGIHILTVEERFESNMPGIGPQPLPYSGGIGTKPGDSRKSSDDELSDENFGTTQESLAMTAVPRDNAAPALPNPVASSTSGNHPYNRY